MKIVDFRDLGEGRQAVVAMLCACRQHWLEENLKTKWVPRFINRRPLIDEERHSRNSCSHFSEKDVALP